MGAAISFDTLELFQKDWLMLSDFIDMWCGKFVGSGSSRMVYEFTLNKTLVVKIDHTNGGFFNVAEWDTYHNIKNSHPKLAKYLAPCIQISNAGKVMLQQKTECIRSSQLPKSIPFFLADTKLQNWGKLGNKVVCHDFANSRIYSHVSQRMVKPEWWSDNAAAPIRFAKDKM